MAKQPTPCQQMSSPIRLGKFSVPVCSKFYSNKVAIKLPADSKTVKFGIAVSRGLVGGNSGSFVDRKNHETYFASNLAPKSLENRPVASQYLFKADFNKSKIAKLTPVLFVPKSTMIAPFINTQFLGQVNNLSPKPGINDSDLIRWEFDSATSDQKVTGKFLNLLNSIRMSQMIEPPSPCATALNQLEGATGWYTDVLGSNDTILLEWFPAMHTRMDSEFVVEMNGGSGVTYMSSAPTINKLLASTLDITTQTSWTIHGNPVGTPYSFTSPFGGGYSAGFNPQTPAYACYFR